MHARPKQQENKRAAGIWKNGCYAVPSSRVRVKRRRVRGLIMSQWCLMFLTSITATFYDEKDFVYSLCGFCSFSSIVVLYWVSRRAAIERAAQHRGEAATARRRQQLAHDVILHPTGLCSILHGICRDRDYVDCLRTLCDLWAGDVCSRWGGAPKQNRASFDLLIKRSTRHWKGSSFHCDGTRNILDYTHALSFASTWSRTYYWLSFSLWPPPRLYICSIWNHL